MLILGSNGGRFGDGDFLLPITSGTHASVFCHYLVTVSSVSIKTIGYSQFSASSSLSQPLGATIIGSGIIFL